MNSTRAGTNYAIHIGILFIVIFIQISFSPAQAVLAAPTQPRPLAAQALPSVTLDVPSSVILGSDVNFTATFDNTGSASNDIGYGPFIDLVIPATGTDGVLPCPGGSPFDGLGTTTITASYLGTPIAAQDFFVQSFDCSGNATHPLAKDVSGNFIVVTGKPGDKLVTIRLPFGSFTPTQPPAAVDVTVNMSNLADVGAPLNIQARGGYEFGYTALDDWCCDLVTNTLTSWTSKPVTPTLFSITKAYNGPEDETATGPNYPRSYTLTVDIANGQPMTNLVVTDVLPINIQFISATSVPGFSSSSLPSTTNPGGTMALTYNNITGNNSASDITITVNFYVPRLNSLGTAVIDPLTGNTASSSNSATAHADWLPVDARDRNPTPPPNTISVNGTCGTPCSHTLSDKSIAIQKGAQVSGGGTLAPTKTLIYTLNFQVSDFFAFNNINIADVISDGQHVDPAFTPTLQINGNPYNWPATDMLSTPLTAIPSSNWTYDVACNYSGTPGSECTSDNPAANDGTTTLTFRVSQEIIQRSLDAAGRMVGGCVDPTNGSNPPDCSYNNLQTTGTIVFHTIVQQNYTDVFPSTDPSVDQGDIVSDNVTVTGDVLDTSTFATTDTETDGSAAQLDIPTGTLTKEIYAVNGAAPGSPVLIKPGDEVTYRIRYQLPTGDEENLGFDDYLPLPIFSVNDPDGNGTAGPGWSFNPDVSAASPPSGTAKFGPTDTFYAYTCLGTGIPAGCLAPGLTSDITNNGLSFLYGDFNGPTAKAYQVDLLFSVTVSSDPFADRLYLTNQVRGTEGSTQNNSIVADSIVSLILTEPVLVHKKGVVATDNPNATYSPATVGPVTFNAPATVGARWAGTVDSPGLAAHPIDSNISGVDAGDLVTFAIVIENLGSSAKGAFDITIHDTLPSIYEIPAGGMNLRVSNGDNSTAFTYHQADGVTAAVPTDIFSTGIRVDDPDPLNGACQAHTVGAGKNIIIITYDLQVRADATPGTYENTAQLTRYAGSDNGPNHIPATIPEDKANSTILTSMAKNLLNTEIENAVNTRPQVVIGELATYRIVITVPEGIVPAAQIVDTLDNGLAFVSCTSVVRSSTDLSTSYGAGDFSDVCNAPTNPVITNSGHISTWTLGNITNTNRNNAVPETLTIQYTVVTLNIVGNQTGTLLNNSAAYSWTGGSVTHSAGNATVIESNVNIAKAVIPTTGDAGDPITYTITLTGATTTDAFDVTVEDTLPALITSPSLASVSDTAGTVTTGNFNLTGNVLTTTTPFNMPVNAGRQIVLTFTGNISYSATPSQTITNTGLVRWTSLNGDFTTTGRSTYNASSVERTGAEGVGGALNDYAKTASSTFTVSTGATTKLVIATSETDTAGTDVAIGEIVRYRVSINVPEGSSPNMQVRDLLPPGLAFLDDNSAKVAFVSGSCPGAATMVSSTLTTFFSSPWVCGDETNVGSITPTFTLPASAISNGTSPGNAFGNGDDPYFILGNITNNDSDPNQEFIVLEYNALVLNVIGNQGGTTLDNQYQVWVNSVLNSTSSTVSVNVVESEVTLDKTNSVLTVVDAGDVVTYTITIANNGANAHAPAYDSHFTDTLPAALTLIPGVSSASALTNNNVSGAGNLVDFTVASIPVGGQAVVTYQATVNTTVTPQQAIDNTGTLNWTSLPGSQGTSSNATGSTTPGNSGDNNGERNGSGGTNNYLATDTSRINTATAAITKELIRTSDSDTTGNNVTIGEVITYGILFTVPEGQVPSDQVVDVLPVGLELIPGSSQVITSAAASSGRLAADYNGTLGPTSSIAEVTAPGGSVTFSFFNIDTAGDNLTTNNTLLLQYQAVVLNIAGNVGSPAATVLTNSATNQVGAGLPSTPVTVTTNVLESKLTIVKSVNDVNPAPGEILTFTLAIGHDSSSQAGAFDLEVNDALPAELTLDLNSFVITNGGATNLKNNSIGNTVLVNADTFPLGSTLTITFKAAVVSAYNSGFDNISTLTWTSLPGSDVNERTGSGIGTNNYNAQSLVTLSEVRNLVKSLTLNTFSTTDLSHASIGDILTYQVVLTIPANTTDTAIVVDNLASGLAYVSCTSVMRSSVVLTTTIGAGDFSDTCSPLVENSGSKVTFNFGTIHNGNPTGVETITITYRAIVLNISANVDNITLDNKVTWTWGGNNITAAAIPVTIRESTLEVVKTVDPAIAALGSVVTFTIKIDHAPSSTAAAYDALLTDGIPTGLTLDQASVVVIGSAGLPVPTVTTSPTQFTVYWSVFPLTESATITYTATFNGPSPLINAANIEWSSIQIDPAPHLVAFSAFNSNSTERRFSPSINQSVNNYIANSSITLRAPKHPFTGFAPGEVTLLSAQPEDKTYQDLGSLWIEIPRLGVKESIVGIPLGADGNWDLTWLSDQAGYLDGTAYPTHAGNSVITSHVYMADGSPGPFVNLHTLQYGDTVIIHLDGQSYIYQVRSDTVVSPADSSAFKHEIYPWLTLITCKDYNEATDSYAHRVIVRAVLIKIQADQTVISNGSGR